MTNDLQVNEDFVRYVLDTYDLSDKTKDRLAKTSLFRLRDNGITKFDEAYTYVDNLAMGVELRHRARIRSLDEEVGKTGRTLHEIIGKEDYNLRVLFEEMQTRRKLSGQEVVECLSYCLDRQDIDVLSKLMEGQKVEFDVSLDYLLENAEIIGERVRQTAQRYEKDGVILLPRRTIVSVFFDPLSIIFGDFRLNDREKNAIRSMYPEFEGNASAIARELRRHPQTVTRFLRNEDLDVRNPGGQPIPEEERDCIISLHRLHNGVIRRIAKASGYDQTTVAKYCRNVGLEVRKQGKRPVSLDVKKMDAIKAAN